jgi:16S rRNA (guanine(966)-N(2))-methyltransferase RsmD
MRIVAGRARGRTLLAPKDDRMTRPTADRVRETLFNVLGQYLDGERVLDLYAGTGALGLEAVSRGAGHAVLVDQDREAVKLCRANAESLGFTAEVEVLPLPVPRALAKLKERGDVFQLVFSDPPYAARALQATLEGLSGGLVASGGTVVLEHGKEEAAPEQVGPFTRLDERRFGDTLVTLYRAS